MFWRFNRSKMKLIGTWQWCIKWVNTGEKDLGAWLYYEDEKGSRRFQSTHVPWVYEGVGGEARLPGYCESKVWEQGGSLPHGFVKVGEE